MPELLELSKDLVVSPLGVEPRTYRLRERVRPSLGVRLCPLSREPSIYRPLHPAATAHIHSCVCRSVCQRSQV
jgi:hypothetical protein